MIHRESAKPILFLLFRSLQRNRGNERQHCVSNYSTAALGRLIVILLFLFWLLFNLVSTFYSQVIQRNQIFAFLRRIIIEEKRKELIVRHQYMYIIWLNTLCIQKWSLIKESYVETKFILFLAYLGIICYYFFCHASF